MNKNPLRELRRKVRKTQLQVAQEIGVKQPTYQGWESSSEFCVPNNRIAVLARVLGTSISILKSLKNPSEPLLDPWLDGDGEEEGNAYFGEVAVHFKNHPTHLLCSISYEQKNNICRQIEIAPIGQKIVEFETLDNRLVILNWDKVSDLYLSHDDADKYGPYHVYLYGGQPLICDDSHFFQIVEGIDTPKELLKMGYSKVQINEVKRALEVPSSELPIEVSMGIANGVRNADEELERHQESVEDAIFRRDKIIDLTYETTWMGNCGERRMESLNAQEIVGVINCIRSDMVEYIKVSSDSGCRVVYVNKDDFNLFTFPLHKVVGMELLDEQ
jgi:transcriptional regulator with XRE-family HTH domain